MRNLFFSKNIIVRVAGGGIMDIHTRAARDRRQRVWWKSAGPVAKRRRGVSLIGLLALCLAALEAAGRPLIIAMEEAPPFEYLEDGQVQGVNVEVILRIMSRLGVSVEFHFYPWSRAWMMAQKGKVDAVSNVSYQPFREDAFFFDDAQRAFQTSGTIPDNFLWLAEYVFFVQTGRLEEFESQPDVAAYAGKHTVGLVRGYSYQPGFTETFSSTKIFSSPRDALQALAAGKVAVVPMERTIGRRIIQDTGLGDTIANLTSPLFHKPYYLLFCRKAGYPDLEKLSERFGQRLAAMRASGEYQSIRDHFMPPDHIQAIQRPLRFVCEDWPPLEYMENGTIKGIDVQVVDHIMNWLGVPYEIHIYPWSRAWMMAENGKADAVLSVSYKAARESVLFYTEEQRDYARTGTLPEDYLWLSEYVFFIKKANVGRFQFDSYDQVKADGITVGRNRDYSYDKAFRDAGFSGPVYSSTERGLLALVAGEIDLYPMDRMVGYAELNRLGLQDSVTTLPKPLFSKPYLSPFCRRSETPDLEKVMDAFYRELRLMRADGRYKRIRDDFLERLKSPALPQERQ
ncbi:MAG: transporter substrate-binding domain-containing protein [Lentisphaeria bacterium]|nr:transporter substrate-binding domain-containing protein [Lentisphaeria bacterium]